MRFMMKVELPTELANEMADSSQIPAMAEPWFHAFEANVDIVPAMNLDDLKKAGPGIKKAVK